MADKRRHQSNRWHRLWKVAVLLGAGSLLLATLVVWAVGQGQFLMAPLSYLPRVWAGVLLLGLAIAGWKWDRRWATGAGLWALFYLLVVLEWRTPRPVKEVVDELTVVAVNVGDQDEASWQEWIGEQSADLIGICEMEGHRTIAAQSADAGGLPILSRVGPFALASRFPISNARSVRPPPLPANGSTFSPPSPNGMILPFLPAARFEVALPDGPVVVYVVHLRSPRADLAHYREWRYWKNTIYGVPPNEWHATHLRHYWQEQYEAMSRVVVEIEKETLPTLVLGDWNVPDSGPRYRQITRSLDDAHREAGTGYGYTFPGDLKHWAALNQPWMRIDYVLCSRGDWEVLACEVQQEAADSQHRAVKARLRLR